MFGLFKNEPKIHGAIEYYHWENWWLETFSEKERGRIQSKYGSITTGKTSASSRSASGFLIDLSSWFDNYEDSQINKKILQKAYEIAKEKNDILDLHFSLGLKVKTYYLLRDHDPQELENAIKACEEQIALAREAAKAFYKKYPHQSLPSHQGYNQLRIILQKQGEYRKAIELCEQAKKQGWMSDWDKQLETLKKKENKTSN